MQPASSITLKDKGSADFNFVSILKGPSDSFVEDFFFVFAFFFSSGVFWKKRDSNLSENTYSCQNGILQNLSPLYVFVSKAKVMKKCEINVCDFKQLKCFICLCSKIIEVFFCQLQILQIFLFPSLYFHMFCFQNLG